MLQKYSNRPEVVLAIMKRPPKMTAQRLHQSAQAAVRRNARMARMASWLGGLGSMRGCIASGGCMVSCYLRLNGA